MTTEPVTKNATFRSAVFTSFDVTLDYESTLSKLYYVAYGIETCPSTGRVHHQGFAYAKNTMRLTQWKKILPGAHIESMKGDFRSNERYCSKQTSLVEFGVRPQFNGHKRTLETFCNRLKNGESLTTVAKDDPVTYVSYNNGLRSFAMMVQDPYEHDTVRGIWIYGVPGAGKSHYAKHRFNSMYLKPQNKWFDGYDGEQSILLDDFDTTGKCLGHYLKIWADKWACTGETKGGKVHLRHHHFVITSNYSIEEIFPDDIPLQDAIKRRFELIYMGQVYKP